MKIEFRFRSGYRTLIEFETTCTFEEAIIKILKNKYYFSPVGVYKTEEIEAFINVDEE